MRTLIEGETEELYDLVSDPDELRNLAGDADYADLLKRYRKTAIKELKRTDAGFVDKLPSVASN